MDLIDSGGYCQEVTFETYGADRNGNRISGGFGYNGIIDLATIKINRVKGVITCNVENESLSYIVKKYKSLKVPINLSGLTLNGETLANIGQTFTMGWPVSKDVTAEYVSNVFQYVLSYISDNRIDFVSDWFTTQDFSLKKMTATYAGLPTIGDVENVTYTNFYGNTVNLAVSYSTTNRVNGHLTYLTCLMAFRGISKNYNHNQILQIGLLGGDPDPELAMYDICDFNFTSDRAISVTTDETFSDGGANVAIVTGGRLKDKEIDPTLSFEDLFRNEDGIFNLQCVFYMEGGRAKIRVEPEGYFYQQTALLSLDDINDMRDESADDILYKAFNIDMQVEDMELNITSICSNDFCDVAFATPTFYNRSYSFDGCGDKERDVSIKFKTLNVSQYANMNEKDIFQFETAPAGLTDGLLVRYNTRSLTPRISQFPIWYQQLTSLHAMPALIMKRHLGIAGVNAMLAGQPIEFDNAFQLKRKVTFKAPLTGTQLLSILATPYYYFDIQVPNADGTGKTLIKNGYIKKLEYPIVSGIASFELYTS